MTIQLNKFYKLEKGKASHERTVTSLWKIAYTDSLGTTYHFYQPKHIKTWYETPTDQEIEHEMKISDWRRCNTPLTEAPVEISEYIFCRALTTLSIHKYGEDYFELNKIYHDKKGNPIRRAFWFSEGKYFTGNSALLTK